MARSGATDFLRLIVLVAMLAGPPDSLGAESEKPGWDLTFHDEFDGPALDPAKWQKRFRWGEERINEELQAYVDDAFQFDASTLRIIGEHRAGQYAGETFDYRSGVIASLFHQRYGWFEIRCRIPAGQGLWPAFWLFGENLTPDVNEIDVYELLGHDPTTVHTTVHWGPSYNVGHESHGSAYTGPDFAADFHTFAVDWDADRIIWYIDGVERFRHTGTGVPQVEAHMITNLAIGGTWPGSPNASTPFPATYTIDYIRVYQRATGGTPGSASSMANLSTRGEAQEGEGVLIPGFAIAGAGTKEILVRAVGPSLADFALTGLLPDPRLEVRRLLPNGESEFVAANDDWDSVGIGEVFTRLSAFPLAPGSTDAALLLDLPAGLYTAQVSGSDAQSGLALVEVYAGDTAGGDARLTNLSTRGHVGVGDHVLIAGFVINGPDPKRVLVRAAGPALADFDVVGFLADPRVDLYATPAGQTPRFIAGNDNWWEQPDADEIAAITETLQAFPLPSGGRDAAMRLNLAPGNYTAIVSGVQEAQGIAIVEVYEEN